MIVKLMRMFKFDGLTRYLAEYFIISLHLYLGSNFARAAFN